MLKHCVFLNFKAHIAKAERLAVFHQLAGLVGEVEGTVDIHFGDNLDYENKSPEYSDGFIVTFTDRAAHLAYERHPQHVAAGGKLVEMCEGGHDGIIVFDIEGA